MPDLIRAAILNSRQSMRPTGADNWIANSSEAVDLCKDRGDIILASVGMNSWEIPLFFAARSRANLQIIVPLDSTRTQAEQIEYFTGQFKINSDFVRWTFIETELGREGTHRFMKLRDKYILSLADKLVPVAIRPDGFFDQYLKSDKVVLERVEDRFRVKYNDSSKIGYEIDRSRINPDLDKGLSDYLIHWTRSSNDRWPGESFHDYYASIVAIKDSYSHSGLATLINIVNERKIKASGRHMHKGIMAVSFSSLAPIEAASLMRYRARYREMSFEPYGIAIKRVAAERLGVRQVIYGPRKAYDKLGDTDRQYFHSLGEKGNWPAENEFRLLSDLRFSDISNSDLAVIVAYPDEIKTAQDIFDGEIVSFFK